MRAVERVFLFGAGASYGARDPHPPMGKGLHRYVHQYLCKAWGELGNLEEEGGGVATNVRERLNELLGQISSFESLVESLACATSRAENELLSKLNLLMASALTPPINDDPKVDCAFAEKPDLYDRFLTANFPKAQELGRASFITFNYDCLLERAICRHLSKPLKGEHKCLCKHVNYRLGNDDGRVEVLKPHGSVNWVADMVGDGKNITTGRLGHDDVWTWTKVDPVDSPIGQGHGEIVLAHYSPGKKAQINPGTLSKIRDIANERVAKAKLITVIGLHLPTDPSEDPFLSTALESMRRAVEAGKTQAVFVNPDSSEVERAASHFGFSAIRSTFADYVERWRENDESLGTPNHRKMSHPSAADKKPFRPQL